MTTQAFVDGVSLSAASWANDADTATYAGLTTIAGTANAITAVGPASMTAYAARLAFRFVPASTNTGATTINPTCNSVALGARNIFYNGVALTGGELRKNVPAYIIDDGTRFHLAASANTPVLRSYLAGLTLSTAGASATMTVAAGMATDSTNAVTMNMTAAIAKTTSAWAVGTGNGGLDTGAIANDTWYHFFEIMRDDTNVVDVLISLSATAPTMPTNYSYKRRIGPGKTNGSAQWTSFTQDGDRFQLAASVLEVNTTNPGTSAVTSTLTAVPTGVNVEALLNGVVENTAAAGPYIYISDLAATDEAPSGSSAPLATHLNSNVGSGAGSAFHHRVRTNTSAQIRYRVSTSSANVTVRLATIGWIDRRGRDA